MVCCYSISQVQKSISVVDVMDFWEFFVGFSEERWVVDVSGLILPVEDLVIICLDAVPLYVAAF